MEATLAVSPVKHTEKTNRYVVCPETNFFNTIKKKIQASSYETSIGDLKHSSPTS